MEHRSDRNGKRPMAFLTLPTLALPVAAGVPPDPFVATVGANRATLPAAPFEVLYGLLLGLKGPEKL